MFTEIVDAVSVIDLRTELATVINSPDPFDTDQSRYELLINCWIAFLIRT